jgi:hypothetical protein
MAVNTVSGAVTALRIQIRAKSGALASADLKNRAASAMDQFQSELAALGFATSTGGENNPSAATFSEALIGMRQQIAAQSSLSTYARVTALSKLELLIAELSSSGLAVGP